MLFANAKRLLLEVRMKKKIFVLLLTLAVLLAGCGKNIDTIEENGKLRVVTSFYPIYLLAQAVTEGAEHMELVNMAQPQTGCLHDYEMTISDMKLLEGADVLIVNGGGMESFLEQALERYPDLIIVDTSAGIELMEDGIEHTHDHGEEAEDIHHHEEETEEEHHHDEEEEAEAHLEHTEEHSHEEDAYGHSHEGNPHIWLSPERAAHQAENIAVALSELDEADAEIFVANAEAFHEAAHELQEKAHAIGIPEELHAAVFHEGFAYLAELFHMEPVFGIFADEYQMPSAKELTEAADEAIGHDIHFFLTAGDNGKIYAETLAGEVGERIVLLDPLTTADENDLTYLERMQKNMDVIEKHWKEVTE